MSISVQIVFVLHAYGAIRPMEMFSDKGATSGMMKPCGYPKVRLAVMALAATHADERGDGTRAFGPPVG
jgi:hypothetical protein